MGSLSRQVREAALPEFGSLPCRPDLPYGDGNIGKWSTYEVGGDWAAHRVPRTTLADTRDFFRTFI